MSPRASPAATWTPKTKPSKYESAALCASRPRQLTAWLGSRNSVTGFEITPNPCDALDQLGSLVFWTDTALPTGLTMNDADKEQSRSMVSTPNTSSTARRAERTQQLRYSESQPSMSDEHRRRQKATKVLNVLKHFLGREDLRSLTALDIGCSTGFIANELHQAGATVTGTDIDDRGLQDAQRRFGTKISFLECQAESLPFREDAFDIVVFNHIYEHVIDPDPVMAEIRRVLRPDGIVYLGLANRFGIMEPHYHLPFLSWPPPSVADRYVRLSGRAPYYYERLRARKGLRKMCRGLNVWDYTYTVLTDPDEFSATDMIYGPLASVPPSLWRLLTPIIPTFIWVGTVSEIGPNGKSTRLPPRRVRQ
jgi:2-polyprenyl-3-methyl-5-hydroxy-6-metoxy-1,4-benzoquinol methylase